MHNGASRLEQAPGFNASPPKQILTIAGMFRADRGVLLSRLSFILGLCLTASLVRGATEADVRPFLQKNCSECHDADSKKGGLDRYLTASGFALREAMAPQTARPKTTTTRYDSWDQREFTGKLKLLPNNRKTIPLVGYEVRTDLIQQNSPRPVPSEDPEIAAQE